MSSQMKVSLLALISTAVAVPHYGQHSRFHHQPSGGYASGSAPAAPYPTGGWGGFNSTRLPLPTGTGAFPGNDKTTTILETEYSTETIVSTIYASPSPEYPQGNGQAPSSVGAADVSTGAAGVSTGAAACGPETVYVTATNKVTVTVPAGGASGAPSSVYTPPASVAQPTSETPEAPEAPASSTPGEGYGVPSETFVLPSSSAIVEQPSSKYEQPAPTPSVEDYTSAPAQTPTPTPSPSEGPASSAAPESSSPASSQAPTPSGSPGYSGTKRGLAYNDANLCKAFSGDYGFAYNWQQVVDGDIGNTKFAPMMSGPNKAMGNTWPSSETWLQNVDTAVKAGSNIVMGFNECDIAAQCGTSPTDACAKWTEYMNPIASAHPDVTILGPSVSNSGNDGQGLSWLSSFNQNCASATWHATNIHFYDQYGGPENTLDNVIERFQAHIEQAAKDYGKPVFVTEFGLNPGTADEANTKEFLKRTMEYMDNSESVKGYSYFMVGTDSMQLNTASGLSAIGEVYASS